MSKLVIKSKKQIFALVGLGIGEQATSSIATLAFTLLAARNSSVDSFGLFSIAWSLVMLLEAMSWGLLGDPVPAAAQRIPFSKLRQYRAALYTYSLAIVVFVGLLTITALPLASNEHKSTIICGFLAFASLRFQQTFRRICHLDHRRILSLFGSLAYGAVLIMGLRFHPNSISLQPSDLLLVWTAGLCTHTFFGLFLLPSMSKPQGRILVAGARRLIRAGLPLVGSALLFWVSSFGMIPFMGAALGTAASGAVRLVFTALSPLFQTLAAISSVGLPILARYMRSASSPDRVQVTIRIYGAYSAGLAVYLLVGGIFIWVAGSLFIPPEFAQLFSVLSVAAVCLMALGDVLRSAGTLIFLAVSDTSKILGGWITSSAITLIGLIYLWFAPSLVGAVALLASANVAGAAYLYLSGR